VAAAAAAAPSAPTTPLVVAVRVDSETNALRTVAASFPIAESPGAANDVRTRRGMAAIEARYVPTWAIALETPVALIAVDTRFGIAFNCAVTVVAALPRLDRADSADAIDDRNPLVSAVTRASSSSTTGMKGWGSVCYSDWVRHAALRVPLSIGLRRFARASIASAVR
jgi:hypothetical protein